MQLRRLVYWETVHQNGWTSGVAEQGDGTFVGYTRQPNNAQQSFVRRSFAAALEAVVDALHRSTGHHECSSLCSEWQMRVTTVDDEPAQNRLFSPERPSDRR